MPTGTSITYIAGGDGTGLPRHHNTIRTTHSPWCTDCKTKHDAADLDTNGRCTRCARADITRAAGAARRAAAEQAAALAAKETPCRTTKRSTKRSKPSPPSGAASRTSSTPTTQTATAPHTPIARTSSTSTAPTPTTSTSSSSPATTQHETPRILHDLDHLIELFVETSTRHHKELVAIEYAIRRLREQITPKSPNAPSLAAERIKKTTSRKHNGPARIILPTNEVTAAYNAGETLVQIAARYDCSHPVVARCLEENGVPRRGTPVTYTRELLEEVRDLYVNQNHTKAEVAEKLGLTQKVVDHAMQIANIEPRPSIARIPADHSVGLKQLINDLDVSTRQIKQWALDQGLVEVIARGLPKRALVEAYINANPPTSATNPTGATA